MTHRDMLKTSAGLAIASLVPGSAPALPVKQIDWFYGAGMWDFHRCNFCSENWVDDAIANKPERALYQVDGGEIVCEHCLPGMTQVAEGERLVG